MSRTWIIIIGALFACVVFLGCTVPATPLRIAPGADALVREGIAIDGNWVFRTIPTGRVQALRIRGLAYRGPAWCVGEGTEALAYVLPHELRSGSALMPSLVLVGDLASSSYVSVEEAMGALQRADTCFIRDVCWEALGDTSDWWYASVSVRRTAKHRLRDGRTAIFSRMPLLESGTANVSPSAGTPQYEQPSVITPIAMRSGDRILRRDARGRYEVLIVDGIVYLLPCCIVRNVGGSGHSLLSCAQAKDENPDLQIVDLSILCAQGHSAGQSFPSLADAAATDLRVEVGECETACWRIPHTPSAGWLLKRAGE